MQQHQGETPDLNSSNCYERKQCHLKTRRLSIKMFLPLMRQNVVTSYELQVVINLGYIHLGNKSEMVAKMFKRAENK